MKITVTINLDDNKVSSYERALRELPGRTDEEWREHLAYALHDHIDAIIEQARLYREWRGEPPNERGAIVCKDEGIHFSNIDFDGVTITHATPGKVTRTRPPVDENEDGADNG